MTKRININSLTQAEVVAAFVALSRHLSHPRQFAVKNPKLARLWLVNHRPQLFTVIGAVSSHQTQSARRGDYTEDADSSDDESDEEMTTDDEDFIVADDE